ncbi:cellulose binding domain-containing protein [Micromonospora echinospora]|uniref:cellulose binding domain-containing protein n=1 Tax=Micromonospora echinospora TaxID=1877 RepID=UPI003405C6E6
MALRMRFAALAALGAIAVAPGATPATAAPATTPADEPPLLCLITTSTVAWANGYQADITIKNISTGRITWQAKLTVPSGTVTGWDATFTRFGTQYTIAPPTHAPTLGPTAIATFGYTGTGSPVLPTVTCTQTD